MTDEQYAELVGLLDREITGLVRRLRSWSPRAWRAAAGVFADRAALALHVAAALAAAGAVVEAATGPSGGAGGARPFPDLPAHALADAVTVTGHDLVTALRAAPAGLAVAMPGAPALALAMPAGSTVGTAGTAGTVAAALLGEVLLHRHDADGSAPGRTAAAAVLAALGGDDLLAGAAARCPVANP